MRQDVTADPRFQAYIDSIKAKTGKSPQDFIRLARAKGLLSPDVKTSDIVAWLQKEFGLGRGHAMAIVVTLRAATAPNRAKAVGAR